MSAAAAKPALRHGAARRFNRQSLKVPVSISRPETQEDIPGRSLNLSEGGFAAILACELPPSQLVGVEFTLPDLDLIVRAKAIVRHHAALQYGLEFVGLSGEQRAMICYWLQHAAEFRVPQVSTETIRSSKSAQTSTAQRKKSPGKFWRRSLFLVAAFVLVAVPAFFYWQYEWNQLEAQLPSQKTQNISAVTVAPEVMQRLIVHKVDPVYPDAARRSNLEGIVTLNAVIGDDGTVTNLKTVSGSNVLAEAAQDAVRWWRFEPYRVQGRSVPVQTTITVQFQR